MKRKESRGAGRGMRIGIVACCAVLAVGLLLFPKSGSKKGTGVVLEAEDAAEVGSPIEVRLDPDEQQTVSLHFPPAEGFKEAAQPLKRKPRLRFEVPSGGEYYLWARTRWMHVCANSFQATIDGGPLLLVGNDEEFGHWHWVRHQNPLTLKAGAHELVIDAVESSIDIDRFVVADDAHPVLPDTVGSGFADAFEGGIPRAWRSASPGLGNLGAGAGERRCLRIVPHEENKLAFAVRAGSTIPGEMYLGVRARRTPGSAGDRDLALIFDHHDPENFSYVLLAPGGLFLGSVHGGQPSETGIGPPTEELHAALADEHPWGVDLEIERGKLRLWLRGRLIAQTPWANPIDGEVGVGSRSGGVDIERVEACVLKAASLQNGFYNDNQLLSQVRGFEPVSGSWRRGHMYAGPITYPLEARAEKGRAVIVTGERWWTRYRASTAVRLHADAWAGLVCQYRDPDNYVMLRVRSGAAIAAPGELQIVRRRGGEDHLLARTEVNVPRERWRVLGVEVTERGIAGLFDEKSVLKISEQEEIPGRIGLVADLASERDLPAARPPVFFLEMDSAPPLSFAGPLKFDASDRGAVQVFLYQDPGNFYRYGVARLMEGGALNLVLERFRDGRVEAIRRAVTSVPETGAPGSEFAVGLDLAVGFKNSKIETWVYGTPFATVAEPVWTTGRIGVQGLTPPAHADFDEVRITAPGESRHEPGVRVYDFSPAESAARDLAAWDAPTGEWGIGIFDNGFLYSLLARTDASRTAALKNRFPLEGELRALSLMLRPRKLSPAEMEIALVPEAEGGRPASLSVVLGLAADPGGSGLRPALRVRAGASEIARAEGKKAWLQPAWHELKLHAGESKELTVTLDGERMLTAVLPGPTRGAFARLSVAGPEGTVFGFKHVELATQP